MKIPALAYAAVALASVAVLATYVWPTAYVIVPNQNAVLRVNRFSGVEEWSSPRGWIRPGVTLPQTQARNVTGELLVKGNTFEPQSGMGELVLENRGSQAMKGVHLEISLIDAEGVVVGTTTQDIDKIERGDKVRVSVMGVTTTASANLLRVDRAYSDWTPGMVASF